MYTKEFQIYNHFLNCLWESFNIFERFRLTFTSFKLISYEALWATVLITIRSFRNVLY